MKLSELIPAVGRPIAFYPKLRRVAGSINAALLLSQLSYWMGRGDDVDGWIYKSTEQITEETGLSYKEQRLARVKLKEKKVVSEYIDRRDNKVYFRVEMDILTTMWEVITKDNTPQKGSDLMPDGQEAHAQREGGSCPKGSDLMPDGQEAHAQRAFRTVPTESTTETTQRDARADKKSSAIPPKKSKPSSESKLPPSWNQISALPEAQKLAEICAIDLQWGLPKQFWEITNEFEALTAMGMNCDRLDRFLDWWHKHDWRGKNGDVPKPAQVRETWKRFEKFLQEGSHASTTGNNQPKRGLGAVSEFAPGFTSRRTRAAAAKATGPGNEN